MGLPHSATFDFECFWLSAAPLHGAWPIVTPACSHLGADPGLSLAPLIARIYPRCSSHWPLTRTFRNGHAFNRAVRHNSWTERPVSSSHMSQPRCCLVVEPWPLLGDHPSLALVCLIRLVDLVFMCSLARVDVTSPGDTASALCPDHCQPTSRRQRSNAFV